MGKDGDFSEGAKVYESKKEKKRRLVMNNELKSDEIVITPLVEIFQAENQSDATKEKVVESNFYRKRSIERDGDDDDDDDDGEFSRKRLTTENTNSVDNQTEIMGKSGVFRVLRGKKVVAGSENAEVSSMRLRSSSTNRVSSSNNQIQREVEKKSISNVKPQKNAGKSNFPKANKKGSKNENLLHDKKMKEDSNEQNGSSKSAVKNKLREQIKSILFSAGWKIEFRPRRGRNYEDVVQVVGQSRKLMQST